MNPRTFDAENLKVVFLIGGEKPFRAFFRLEKDCSSRRFDHNQIRGAHLILLNFFKTFYIGANLLLLSFSFITPKSYGLHSFHRDRSSGRCSVWFAGAARLSGDRRSSSA